MHGVTIDADVAEVRSGVVRALEVRGARVRVSQLEAGDYLVGDGIGIERKSVLDLHFSIGNQRLWSQLLAYRAALQRLYLLVEGPTLDDGKLSEAGVRGALLEIGERGVTVLRSTDAGDSAAWILRVAVRAQRDGSRPRPRRRRRPTIVAPIDLVAGITGVGPRRAQRLLTRFESVAGIAAAGPERLQEIPGIGPSTANAIRCALTAPGASRASGKRPAARSDVEQATPGGAAAACSGRAVPRHLGGSP
jgi:DNA excision repair protein ERCC-4